LLAIQDGPAGSSSPKAPVWTLTDPQGTVKDYLAKPPTAGADSGLVATRSYSAFGTPEPAQVWASRPEGNFTDVSGAGGFFYVGQEYDAETGLQYSRARYYDPRSREFIGQDPLAFTAGDTNLYRRVGNSPVNATDPSGLETYWEISGYFASTFVHNVGVTVSTAGKTIWKTGEEMGDAIGTHVARTWYSRQDEMTALHETVTTTAAGLSQLAQTVYDDPLGVAQSLGASSLRYLDRLTSDPETSGQLFGHGAVVWASAGAGGAAANATRSIAVAGNLSAAAGRASAAMRRLIPSRRLREGLEEATELPEDAWDTLRVVAPSNNVRVFRVEGTPNSHVVIGEGGMVAIKEGNQTVFFNFGSKARAEQYLAQKIEKGLPGATVKSFEVPRSFLDDLRASAVSERRARLLPDRPFIVDVTKAADQFGLRPEQIEALRRAIIQGTGQEGF
jgi:RHS repeat-associated protein